MGGTLPAALAADWLTSAWDQNTGMRIATPGTAAVEEVAAAWLLDLLGLPPASDVGFTQRARRWPTSPVSPPLGTICWTGSDGMTALSA